MTSGYQRFEISEDLGSPAVSPPARTPSRSQSLLASRTASASRSRSQSVSGRPRRLLADDGVGMDDLRTFCFEHVLFVSLALQFLLISLLYLINPSAFRQNAKRYEATVAICALVQFVQLLVIALASWEMLLHLAHTTARPSSLWRMYIANIILFAGIYMLCFLAERESLFIPRLSEPARSARYHQIHEAVIAFFYFSSTTMTSTGYGEIHALHWYTQAFVSVQMIVAIVYRVGFFGVALVFFRSEQTEAEQAHAVARPRGTLSRALKWLRVHVPGFERARKGLIRYLLVCSILLQGINMGVMMAVDPHVFQKDDYQKHVVSACILFQVVQCFLILSMSLRLVKKINNHEVSGSFLTQSYLATSLLFGGLYFLVYLLHSSYFDFAATQTSRYKTVPEMVWKFIYFSLSTQTTTGFGDVFPTTYVSRALVSLQLLVTMLYEIIILGLGISTIVDKAARRRDTYSTL